jgi:uncharacterized protein (DUF58 family)
MPATAPANPQTYLDPRTLAAVGNISLRARMIVEGLMTGMHRSPMQGFSVEFAQHRPYTPGDDTRFLDWKVFGKTDKLYLKQYLKETNLDLMILVDVSGSMAYGSGENGWRKFDHAAATAAAMAFVALQQQDRVALTTFSDRSGRATRLSNNRGHWRDIVEVLAAAELEVQEDNTTPGRGLPGGRGDETAGDGQTSGGGDVSGGGDAAGDGRSDLLRLFDEVNARLSHRSLVCLISDLFDDPAHLESGLARLAYRRHDVILMQVMDDAELNFPFRSPSDFIGLEAEGRLPLDPASLRKAYLKVVDEHLRAIERSARKHRFDHVLLNTAEPLGPALSHYLAKREAMISR